MLKLRYLVDDRELAQNILSRWEHDQDHLHLLDHFRISANAVYPYKNKGTLHFLRFAPHGEKEEEQIGAELEFLRYLCANEYPCLTPVESRLGNELEVVELPQGRYYATAFVGVPGKSLARQNLTPELLYSWGQAMGRLHRASAAYTPRTYMRHSHVERLRYMSDVLAAFPDERAARKELGALTDVLDTLPQTPATYGLIHYDFETDNVIYDPLTEALNVIDFDDAVYHWFAMDVTTALASYEGDAPALACEQFVAGYRAEHPLDEEQLALMPIFRRYQDLYLFARALRSASDSGFGEEPPWMTNLRSRLYAACEMRRARFGLK